MNKIYDGNAQSIIKGFYYDAQMSNPLNCITLHANTRKVDSKDGDGWGDYPDSETDEKGGEHNYSKNPLCTAILAEDFSVSIANNWTDFGGNAIGQLWSSVKPLAPYAGEVMRSINTMYDKQKNQRDSKVDSSMIANGMKKGVDFLHKFIDDKGNNINSYLNSALVVQGTRFSYYDGTGIAFSNLGMKFTIFPKYNGENVITVPEQVEKLYPYFIGKFDAIDLTKMGSEWKKWNGMFAWQKPPAGFQADMQDVASADKILRGTLRLKVGPYYYINNLVCADATFTFSKQMVKTGKKTNISLSPLYCDVAITLKPVTKFSDEALKKFVDGSLKVNGGDKTAINILQDKIAKDLSNGASST